MSKKTQKEAKAKLPGLEHRYEYRSRRRATPEGIALEALGGDRGAIATLASVGAYVMHDHWARGGDGNAEYALWLAGILEDIANGVEPNKAFGWSVDKGRWKLHNGETWGRVEKAYEVARTVEAFSANIIGKSYEDAVTQAAAVWRVQADLCRSAMTSECADRAALTKTVAIDLALDMVAAHGAGGHHVARETARDYYKELVGSRGTD